MYYEIDEGTAKAPEYILNRFGHPSDFSKSSGQFEIKSNYRRKNPVWV